MKPEDSILLVALAALIFMMFWNSRKRKKQAEELQSQLGKGAAIVTHSGIYGVIESIDADQSLKLQKRPSAELTPTLRLLLSLPPQKQ